MKTLLIVISLMVTGCAAEIPLNPDAPLENACSEDVKAIYWSGVKQGENPNTFSLKIETLFNCKLF